MRNRGLDFSQIPSIQVLLLDLSDKTHSRQASPPYYELLSVLCWHESNLRKVKKKKKERSCRSLTYSNGYSPYNCGVLDHKRCELSYTTHQTLSVSSADCHTKTLWCGLEVTTVIISCYVCSVLHFKQPLNCPCPKYRLTSVQVFRNLSIFR